ncbi:putative choline transporter [Helianthus debilis subsp. tardiflorus]
MNHTQTSFSSSDDDAGTMTAAQQSAGNGNFTSLGPTVGGSRHWHDVFWLGIFLLHSVVVGLVLGVLGLNRFLENQVGLTEDYWPLYAIAGAISTVMGWIWLLLISYHSNQMMKVSVHLLTTYLTVLSVLCLWGKFFFWSVAFAIRSGLKFLYIILVIEGKNLMVFCQDLIVSAVFRIKICCILHTLPLVVFQICKYKGFL